MTGPSVPGEGDEVSDKTDSTPRPTFVLSLDDNPHPEMLERAIERRRLSRLESDNHSSCFTFRDRWRGFMEAMAAATGYEASVIEAWMDHHEAAG